MVKERRSQILIDPPVQLRLVGLVLLSGLVTFLLGVAFAWLNWRLLSRVLASSSAATEGIMEAYWFYGALGVGAFLVVMSILAFLTLLVTNRVVGPLYRLRKELNRMLEEEEVEMISVRDRDYIEDFVRELNRFLLQVQRSGRSLSVESEEPASETIGDVDDLLKE